MAGNSNSGVKGGTNNPRGRKKGVPNKATADARKTIKLFVEKNAPRLEKWLDQVAAEDPAKAFGLVQSMIEYTVPKLQRTENQQLDKDGKPADPSVTVKFE